MEKVKIQHIILSNNYFKIFKKIISKIVFLFAKIKIFKKIKKKPKFLEKYFQKKKEIYERTRMYM